MIVILAFLARPSHVLESTDRVARADTVRVLTFNIRYGSANDGPDRWEFRAPRVIETMRELAADIAGLQEAEAFQIQELLVALPQFAAVGVARDDGRTRGEACPILYDRTRFTVAATGTFWLSDTPNKPGSISWDNVCTRVCTWARFIDLKSGRGLYVYNLHYDHVGQQSRENASKQVRAHFFQQTTQESANDPLIVLGDLNAPEDNAAIRSLKGEQSSEANDDKLQLRDTYRVFHPNTPAGTFTGFQPDNDGGTRKIDYILIGPGLMTKAADIDRRKIDGRYPSDHFPVWADLMWRSN